MQATHRDLAELFPDKAERIEALMSADHRFCHLCTRYGEVVEATRRRATDAVFTDARKAEELRRTRHILAEAIAESLA